MNSEANGTHKNYVKELEYQDASVTLNVRKSNDQIRTSLNVRKDGETIVLSFYLEPYAEQIYVKRSLDSIM